MVKIAVQIRKTEEKKWDEHKTIELSRMPKVGEHLSFDLNNSPGYEVKFVNHYGFEHPDSASAEVFVMPARVERIDWSAWQS